VENYYQAQKTLDRYLRLKISKLRPGEAKRLRFKLRDGWDKIKVEIMEAGLRQKFSSPSLKIKLLETGNEILQEGNYWGDEFWGVNLRNGRGSNNLGKLLMKIRRELL